MHRDEETFLFIVLLGGVIIGIIGIAIVTQYNPPIHEVTVEIPVHPDATLAHAWVYSPDGFHLLSDSNKTVPLPFNLTFSSSDDIDILKVNYYNLIQYSPGVYQLKLVDFEQYSVNVTELWKEES